MVNELNQEKKLLKAFEHDKLMREKEINNQIKITNLKKND